jgi:hypothetical protein
MKLSAVLGLAIVDPDQFSLRALFPEGLPAPIRMVHLFGSGHRIARWWSVAAVATSSRSRLPRVLSNEGFLAGSPMAL